ncbi:MAG: PAS domain S-box protein [Spirochaetia bacterium]
MQSIEREAGRRLNESEERFRLALHNSSIVVATCDRELRYTWIYNPHPDFIAEEVIGKRDDELLTNKGTRRLTALKQAVVEGGGELREEIVFPTSEGEQIYDIIARAITDEHINVVGVTTVAWDVTALKELEIRYSCLYDSIKDAIIIADTDQEILDCNPAFADLFGYSLDEVKGSKLDFIFAEPEEYRDIFREIGERRDKFEYARIVSYRKKNGELFSGETSFSSLSDEFRGIWGATWVIRDVTDRELMERQLVESQKMEALGQLAGGIAHDFNNVLTAISGASQILDRRIEEGSSTKQLIDAIRSSVKRGNAVTDRMLTFTRSEEPETKPVLLASFLSEFQEIAIHSLPRDVHVSIGKANTRQWVYVDPVQFQQVLFTLSINAADAMPDGGRLSFNVRRPRVQEIHVHVNEKNADPKNYWTLEVSDEGIGMDEKTQSRIFEPFFTTKDSTKGTGLGLAVVSKIIRMNKGWIEVFSTPGSGSTFILGLPAAEAAAEEPAAPEAVEQGGGETILIVDDEDTIRNMLELVLSENGYRIITGKTAGEALNFLEKEGTQTDLVVTDIGLPDMNGKKLIVEIKNQYPELPILAMTGYMEEKLDDTLHKAGADVVVRKPYDIDELSRHIYKLLRVSS